MCRAYLFSSAMTDPALATSVSNLRSVSSKNARNVLNFIRSIHEVRQTDGGWTVALALAKESIEGDGLPV